MCAAGYLTNQAMPDYDESQIVEYYPDYIRIEAYMSSITVRTRLFERYVYRPIVGHDILVNQIPGAFFPGIINHETDRYGYASQEELTRLIGYDLYDYDNKNWTPFATKIAAFVSDKELEGEHFTLEAEEGIGKLYVMDETRGWSASIWNADCQPQRTSDPCSLCFENLPDNAAVLLGMKCGHVFHKDCLTEWIWNNANCPNCRAVF